MPTKSITRNFKHNLFGYVLMVICLIAILWAVISLACQTGISPFVDSDHIDHIGSYMGGLVGIVTIYYLYWTLRSQNLSFRLSSFEERFLELMKLQRDKTKELTAKDTKTKDNPIVKGQDAIELFIRRYSEAQEIICDFMDDKPVQSAYNNPGDYQKDALIWTENLVKKRLSANIAYLITFIGVKATGIQLLKDKYLKKYNSEYVEAILKKFQLMLAEGDPLNRQNANAITEANILTSQNKVFSGFQHEFGNYFRQLYQMVNYVNCQDWLLYDDKYGYVKMLRAQLSNQEEELLFYNSLSDVGMAWEYVDKGKENPNVNNQLLTKYNLLKNIPCDTTFPKVEQLYPNIAYEDAIGENENRKNLVEEYV